MEQLTLKARHILETAKFINLELHPCLQLMSPLLLMQIK